MDFRRRTSKPSSLSMIAQIHAAEPDTRWLLDRPWPLYALLRWYILTSDSPSTASPMQQFSELGDVVQSHPIGDATDAQKRIASIGLAINRACAYRARRGQTQRRAEWFRVYLRRACKRAAYVDSEDNVVNAPWQREAGCAAVKNYGYLPWGKTKTFIQSVENRLPLELWQLGLPTVEYLMARDEKKSLTKGRKS